MPIYEYECSSCGKRFEFFLGLNDKPPQKCSHCKKGSIRKLVSNCSFQLKGTGWYVTDYARKDKSDTSKSSKKAESGDTTASSSSSENKKPSETAASESPKSKAA